MVRPLGGIPSFFYSDTAIQLSSLELHTSPSAYYLKWTADRRGKKIKINECSVTLWGLCSLRDGAFSSWRSAVGWEKQEEAVLSPPASEAGRPDGLDSVLSEIARWG